MRSGLSAALPAKQWDPQRSSLVIAISFTALGVLCLLGAIIQYGQMLKTLEQGVFTYKAPRALTMVVAILLLVIGTFSIGVNNLFCYTSDLENKMF